MVALPGQLFYSTQIPAYLWFLARDKSGKSPSPGGRGGLESLVINTRGVDNHDRVFYRSVHICTRYSL
jgi:type I restriction-modification system DNA methylase subunit